MTAPRRGPKLIEDDALEELPPAPDTPNEAPPIDDDATEEGGTAPAATGAAMRLAGSSGGSALSRVFWSSLAALFLLGLGLWFWTTVETLIARNLWLGRAATVLAIVAGVSLLGMALRELAALSRLRKLDDVREKAVRARATRDRSAALGVLDALDRTYRARPELASARADVATRREDVLDGDAMIDLAERSLMAPLDAAAQSAVRRGARDAAAATALIPLAFIDVVAALLVNLRMIRTIAEVYGGRAGWLGSWRLLKAVAGHLIAAGAISVADDMIGPALGGGALSKVSRRFGEGLVNGALTARIGVAAMEVCRPLPFAARSRPSVGGLIKEALSKPR